MFNKDSQNLTRSTKTAIVHKVIDISPATGELPVEGPIAKILGAMDRHAGRLFALAGVLFAVVIVLLLLPHGARKIAASAAAPAQAQAPSQRPAQAPVQAQARREVPPQHQAQAQRLAQAAPAVSQSPASQRPVLIEINFSTAVQQGLVECQWRGNGKDRLFMDACNTGAQPLRLHLAAGQLLASVDSTVVVLKSQTIDFAPHALRHEEFPTVATSSANKVTGAEYHLSSGALPDLDKLFAYVADHPAASPGAVQTATLILTENLPLSAFARFNELSAGAGNRESQDFQADTVDILSALTIVKDIGIDRPLAVTIDPQLEVEAMIDPSAHALAMQYYGINDEWAFWKNQLTEGDPSTRHYALYGIARSYPDVALQMLPKWARGETVNSVYRLSAVQALAQTGRPEAIPILRELEREFGGGSDLGHAAHLAANFLDAQFARAGSVTASLGTEAQIRRQAVLASVGN